MQTALWQAIVLYYTNMNVFSNVFLVLRIYFQLPYFIYFFVSIIQMFNGLI